MTVLFSRKCEYALQGILYLAENRQRGNISAAEIATDLGISQEFISKTLQGLVKVGMIQSSRGKTGGFSLARDPENITLLEIVKIIDGNEAFENCVLGLPQCHSDAPCALHEKWLPLRDSAHAMLSNTTVGQFKSS